MPGVEQRIFNKPMLTTPEQITPAIEAMARELAPKHDLSFVITKTDKSARSRECFFNVRSKVDRDGGEILYGWVIWEWRSVFIEAEHHAVWLADGNLLDITPHSPDVDRVLFLPDPTRIYDYTTEKRVPNFRRSLGQIPMVPAYFNAFDDVLRYIEANSIGRRVEVDPRRLNFLQRSVMEVQASIFVALAETTDLDDRCFCASKRKFKNCCAPLIDLSI